MKHGDKFKVAYFIGNKQELFITEFGYSMRHHEIKIGPSIREFYVLHFELRGRCELGELDVEVGDAFVLSKNTVHSFRAAEPSERYWICFGGSRAEELLCAFGIPTDAHAVFKVSNAPMVARMLSGLFRLSCEHESSDEGERYAISALMGILPLLSSAERVGNSPIEDYVVRAVKYMRQNYGKCLKMSEVAARLCISEKHLYRLFIEKTGLSPKATLQKIQMEKAVSLLKETGMSVSEIAAATGFSSHSRFYQSFVARYGVSPSKFRDESLKRVANEK